MYVVRLQIKGFRGVRSADLVLDKHSVLVGPNNAGKTTVIEALALLFGRDRLVRTLTEHDFHGSNPVATSRIICVATLTGFEPNDAGHFPAWFGFDRGVEKWLDPRDKSLSPARTTSHTELAVQIGFSARFDLDDLEAESIRFFVDDETALEDPFADAAALRTVHTKVLQELGFFLVPASRTWDRWISFSSELFRRVVATRGSVPAKAVLAQRDRLRSPSGADKLETQAGLESIVDEANSELSKLIARAPKLQLRLTATDSNSVLESVVPHFEHLGGPSLPSARQGTGLVSLQILLLLMQFGKAREETGKAFVLAVEEPEIHIQPSQQKRLVNRLNALCDQTIVTTHSPIVAAMFPAQGTLFVETSGGVLQARPLMETMPSQPSNHQQHLLYAWREKLIAALMHECVIIPEGFSDVAWLDTLQTALEQRQDWSDQGDVESSLSTFVGIVPTADAKVVETLKLVSGVHGKISVLLDGDAAGTGYLDDVKSAEAPPQVVVRWPQDWSTEHAVAWIAAADEAAVLRELETALGCTLPDCTALVASMLKQKSYAPAHHAIAVALVNNDRCRRRAARLLGALNNLVRHQVGNELFEHVPADSTSVTSVFSLLPSDA